MSLLQNLLKRFKKAKKQTQVKVDTVKPIDTKEKKRREEFDEELLRQLLDPNMEGIYVVDPEKIAQKRDLCESESYILK